MLYFSYKVNLSTEHQSDSTYMIFRRLQNSGLTRRVLRRMSSMPSPADEREHTLREILHDRSINSIAKNPIPAHVVYNPLFELPFHKKNSWLSQGVRLVDSLLWAGTTAAAFYYGGWVWSTVPGIIALWKMAGTIGQALSLRQHVLRLSIVNANTIRIQRIDGKTIEASLRLVEFELESPELNPESKLTYLVSAGNLQSTLTIPVGQRTIVNPILMYEVLAGNSESLGDIEIRQAAFKNEDIELLQEPRKYKPLTPRRPGN